MIITGYEAICNLGGNIDDIFYNAINGNNTCFEYLDGYLTEKTMRAGVIKCDSPHIENENFDMRCNQLLQKNTALLKIRLINCLKNIRRTELPLLRQLQIQVLRNMKNHKIKDIQSLEILHCFL